MLPSPFLFLEKSNNSKSSRKKKVKLTKEEKELYIEYFDSIKNSNNWLLITPTFEEWLAMKKSGIDYKKYSTLYI